MKTLKEIVKNKAFYISFIIPFLAVALSGYIWIGILINIAYAIFKRNDLNTVRAIIIGTFVIIISLKFVVIFF